MPQIRVDCRNLSEPRKCDVPAPKIVTFESRDESPNAFDFTFSNFIRNGQSLENGIGLRDNNFSGRKPEDDKVCLIHNQLSLSVSEDDECNCNQLNKTDSNCDVNLSDLLNTPNLKYENNHEQITFDFTGFSVHSPTSTNKLLRVDDEMKIIKDTESNIFGDFPDILSSISLSKDTLTPNLKLSIDDIRVPDLSETNCDFYKPSPSNLDGSLEVIDDAGPQVKCDFSDILSSISFPEENAITQSKLKSSSLLSSDSDHSLTSTIKYLNVDDNIQIKDTESIHGDFSDILSSISLSKSKDASTQSGFNNSSLFLPDKKLCIDDIRVPDLNELNCDFYKPSPFNLDGSLKVIDDVEPQVKCDFSDILSSISFPEENVLPQSRLASSLSSNSYLDDIGLPALSELSYGFAAKSNCTSEKSLSNSAFKVEENLSDMLSCIEDYNVSTPNELSESVFSTENSSSLKDVNLLSELSNESMREREFRLKNGNTPSFSDILDSPSVLTDFLTESNSQLDMSLPSLDKCYVDDNNTGTIKHVNLTNRHHISKVLEDDKSEEFSFFSTSPESFSTLTLPDLNRAVKLQDSAVNENVNDISMLDLFKAVNGESTKSFSGYLNDFPDENPTDSYHTEGANNSEILDIDLSSCVKKTCDVLYPEPLKNDVDLNAVCKTNIQSPPTPKLQNGVNSLELANTINLKQPQMNLKQSLFAKSLSCKPKKNPILMQKVASIKTELFQSVFGCLNFDENDMLRSQHDEKKMNVRQSDHHVLDFIGRRLFGPNAFCELQ